MNSANGVIAQELCFPIEDAQKLLRNEKECDLDRRELQLRREQDIVKDQRIANLEKELELAKQEIFLKDKVIEVKDMEISIRKRSFDDMKEVTDRALKLAEIAKPQSQPNWMLQGLLGLTAFVVGILISM